MNAREQILFLYRALERGLNIPQPVIVQTTSEFVRSAGDRLRMSEKHHIEFELDDETYIVTIRKAQKEKA